MATPSQVVEAFRNLPTNQARVAAINALLDELTPAEWRAAKAKAAQRTFTFDVIGSLPVELAAQVFSHLDIATPFRLQRVSRQWQNLLASPHVLKSVLKTWCRASDGPLQGEAALQHDSYALCALKARYWRRFTTGKSWTYLEIKLLDLDKSKFSFQEDTMAWVSHHHQRVLHVYNLRTGQHRQEHNAARYNILKVALSDQLVVFITSDNTCHARNLTTGEMRSFRLPPAMFSRLTCQGKVVAGGASYQTGIDVFVWDFDTQVCRTLSFQRPVGYDGAGRRGFHIVPDPALRFFTMFSDSPLDLIGTRPDTTSTASSDGEAPNPILYSSKFSLNGEKLCTDRITIIDAVWIDPRDMAPVDREGRFALAFECFAPGTFLQQVVTLRVQFDPAKHKFVHICPRGSKPARLFDPHAPVTHLWVDDELGTAPKDAHLWAKDCRGGTLSVLKDTVWWKDTYYRFYKEEDEYSDLEWSSDSDLGANYATRPTLRATKPSPPAGQIEAGLLATLWPGKTPFRGPMAKHALFLNDKYLVVVVGKLVWIRVFDEHVKLPDPAQSSDLAFRECTGTLPKKRRKIAPLSGLFRN